MAKNQKPWKNSDSGTTILLTQHNAAKGPQAKSSRIWKQDMRMPPVVFEVRGELKGLKAKNFSPERDKHQVAYRRKKRSFSANFALFNSIVTPTL
ncbi:hypothetical protein WJR50_29670 [Catalinimonas sp. 4WD22]|uniref:hypothetical protein n=1 Tax=Catalinimonas locisalis TaxID=3133978 RepID=UPI003100B698